MARRRADCPPKPCSHPVGQEGSRPFPFFPICEVAVPEGSFSGCFHATKPRAVSLAHHLHMPATLGAWNYASD